MKIIIPSIVGDFIHLGVEHKMKNYLHIKKSLLVRYLKQIILLYLENAKHNVEHIAWHFYFERCS